MTAEISTSPHAAELIGDNGGMREAITALVAVAAACSNPEPPFAGRREVREGKMLACLWAGTKAGMCDHAEGCLTLATVMSGPNTQWSCRQQLVVYCVEKPGIEDSTYSLCFGNLAACRDDIHGPCVEVKLTGDEAR